MQMKKLSRIRKCPNRIQDRVTETISHWRKAGAAAPLGLRREAVGEDVEHAFCDVTY
jgi:hypothetical protein